MNAHHGKVTAAWLAAVTVGVLGALTACSQDPGALPPLPERCPEPFDLSAEELSAVFADSDTASGAVTAMTLGAVANHSGSQLSITKHDSTALSNAVKVVKDKTECGKATVVVPSGGTLQLVRALGLAEVRLDLGHMLDIATPADLYALRTMKGITGIKVVILKDWDRLPVLPEVDVAELYFSGESPDPEILASAAAKFPAVTTLWLHIDALGDWDNAAFADLTSVKKLHFSVTAGLDSMSGISKETLALIMDLPNTLPGLTAINDVAVDSLDPGALGAPDPKTRETILAERAAAEAEKKAQEAEDELGPWATDVLEAGYSAGAAADAIVGPVVVTSSTTSQTSIADGVRGKEWNTIPAAKLCKAVEGCVSVVEVGFREGATSGSYTPEGGGAVAFSGKLGETTVTIYNSATKLMAGPIVVASTEPPQRVSSESEAVGPSDYAAAYAWIAAHTPG